MKKIKNDKRRIFFNSAIVNIANISDKFIFVILTIIIARYLDIEQFGEYITALGYATLFSAFTDIGINQTLIRAINLEKDLQAEHFGNALILKSSLFLIVYIVMTCTLFFTNYNQNTIYLILILGIVRIGNEFIKGFYALYDARENFIVSSISNSIFSLSFLIGTILVVLYQGNYFHIVFVRFAIVVFFILVIGIYTFKCFSIKIKFNTLAGFIKQAVPFSLATIYWSILSKINIIILSLMKGTIYTGIFSNGMLFLDSLLLIPNNLNRVLIPYLYKISDKEKKSKFQFAFDFYSKMYLITSSFILLILFLFSKDIILLIFSDKYKDSINVLRILSFSLPFIFSVAPVIMITLDQQKYYTRFTGIAVVVNIIANFVGIYFLKSEGAAIATVLTFFTLYLLSHYFLIKRKYIRYFTTLKVFFKLIFILAVLFIAYQFYFCTLFVVISIISISLLFIILVLILLIRKDDLRILYEIFGINR